MSWSHINVDMFWISINIDMTPNSINLICLEYLSTLIRFWIFIDIDMAPNSINTDRTPIYQLDTSWIFINVDTFWIFINIDRTPNSISTNIFGYLSMLICFGYLSTFI